MAERAVYHKLEGDSEPLEGGDQERETWQTVGTQDSRSRWWSWLRLAFEVVLVVLVLSLGARLATDAGHGSRGRNEPLSNFGVVDTVFMNDSRYANEDAFQSPERLRETLAQWLPLSSKGRGYVELDEEGRERLDSPPYLLNPLLRPHQKEVYMMSGFHQLHCLSTIMNSYARLRQGEDESKMGYHIAHCFDYIRQALICAGDSTLEGNNTDKYPGVEIPWGTAHRCVNWEALQDWADERTVWTFPPGIDVL